MQGLTGQQLAVISEEKLVERGICSKLQRVQLLNRRDELLLMDEGSEDDRGAQV